MTDHIHENSCENLRFPYNLVALFRMLTPYASNKMFCYNYISISTGLLLISDSKMRFSFWKVNSSNNKFLFSFLSEFFPNFLNFANVLIIYKVINNNLFVIILCLFGLLGFHIMKSFIMSCNLWLWLVSLNSTVVMIWVSANQNIFFSFQICWEVQIIKFYFFSRCIINPTSRGLLIFWFLKVTDNDCFKTL